MEVTRDDLEAALAVLEGSVGDRLAGIHGPETLAWHYGREVANFIGAGRAMLLQLAHPPVARAIAEHSRTFVDLQGRFERTFAIVFSMTFGDLDAAMDSSRRLHRIHDRVRGRLADGSAYAANDRASLRWVYSTLLDSVFAVRRLCGDPIAPSACELYYRESRRFALLFGLHESDLPATYAAFRDYVARGADGDLCSVSREAAEMSRALLSPPHRFLAPISSAFSDITAALLPERLATDFGLSHDRGRLKRATRAAALFYRALARAPAQVRFFPRYLDAMARVGRRAGPARRIDQASARILLAASRLRSQAARPPRQA